MQEQSEGCANVLQSEGEGKAGSKCGSARLRAWARLDCVVEKPS